MVKLVDTLDLGSSAEMRAGSSPVPGIFHSFYEQTLLNR